MKVIKILLEFKGWDPNGSKKTLKKSARIFTPKPHPQPGLPDGGWGQVVGVGVVVSCLGVRVAVFQPSG